MLKKLSLAALIAMTSMSVATATPLTEAIKGVDIGGEQKLKFTYDDNGAGWETSGKFKFAVPVSEELKLKTSYKFESDDDNPDILKNSKFFLEYNKAQLNVIFGKIPVNTPITDGDSGEGLIATYTVSDNLDFVLGGLDSLNSKKNTPGEDNTYVLAAIYNADSLNLEGWFFKIDKQIKSNIVVRAAYKTDILKINGDFATAKPENGDTQLYFNIAGEGKIEGFSVMAGFATTSENGGAIVLNDDAAISKDILPTKQTSTIAQIADARALYVKVGYDLNSKINVYGALANIGVGDNDDNEMVLGGSYKYTDNIKVSAYYSTYTEADSSEIEVKGDYSYNKKMKFSAKYTLSMIGNNNTDTVELEAKYSF
ncbi:MAG TPA: major outer membrane protein [Piscirickettsiaceae bacterium]|nr:major outer membrane protein [Piscirickettsiaceae bacterium]